MAWIYRWRSQYPPGRVPGPRGPAQGPLRRAGRHVAAPQYSTTKTMLWNIQDKYILPQKPSQIIPLFSDSSNLFPFSDYPLKY